MRCQPLLQQPLQHELHYQQHLHKQPLSMHQVKRQQPRHSQHQRQCALRMWSSRALSPQLLQTLGLRQESSAWRHSRGWRQAQGCSWKMLAWPRQLLGQMMFCLHMAAAQEHRQHQRTPLMQQ